MKRNYLTVVLSIAAAVVVTGCGGSSSNDTSDTNTGYFVDAAVAGADYNTSSGLTGTTNKFGQFKFKKGDEVEFKIGKVVIGRAKPKLESDGVGLVTPEELAEGNETVKTLILQLLQSLDADGNPENGITIPESVKKELEELNTTINIHHIEDEKELLEVEPLSKHIDKDHDGMIDVDEDDAIRHFENSITKWHSGERPDKEAKKDKESKDENSKGKSEEAKGKGQGAKNHASEEMENAEKNATKGMNQGKGYGKNTQKNAQEQEGEDKNCTHDDNATEGFNLDTLPKSELLTQDNKNDLAYMGNEERLAYDVYTYLYNYHKEQGNEIKQLTNIATKSETKHIATVRELVKRYELTPQDLTNLDTTDAPVATVETAQDALPAGKYDIAHVQELYDALVAKGQNSVQDALEVGCMVEVTDINDLNPKIQHAIDANATDLQEAFEFLRNGSYNHYWAFDKGLKNMGVEEGCCVLGDEWCHPEYPNNEKGNN